MTLDPDILADLAVEILPSAYVRVTPMAHAATPLGAGFGVTRFASPTKAFKVIYLGQDLRFQAPVRIGDTVTAMVTVTEINLGKNRVKLATVLTNQDGAEVTTGTATVMPPTRK